MNNNAGKTVRLSQKMIALGSTGLLAISLLVMLFNTSSCKVQYTFKDAVIPDSIKTVYVNFIENRAPYINPNLSPRLTDRLRQKIVSQTKLSQTNDDNADWVISGTITNYSFTTSGISQGQEATNRLTVSVKMTLVDNKAGETKEYDVSRNIDFRASLSIQQAEANLFDELIKGLADDIFNRLFSDW